MKRTTNAPPRPPRTRAGLEDEGHRPPPTTSHRLSLRPPSSKQRANTICGSYLAVAGIQAPLLYTLAPTFQPGTPLLSLASFSSAARFAMT